MHRDLSFQHTGTMSMVGARACLRGRPFQKTIAQFVLSSRLIGQT